MKTWAEVAEDFTWDGAWRDIYVLGSTLADWERFLREVRSGRWPFEYLQAGELSALPASVTELGTDHGPFLRINILPGGLNCHFWTSADIELDFDPRDISDQKSLDVLSAFCGQLASVIGKTVIVTFENMAEAVILEYMPA